MNDASTQVHTPYIVLSCFHRIDLTSELPAELRQHDRPLYCGECRRTVRLCAYIPRQRTPSPRANSLSEG